MKRVVATAMAAMMVALAAPVMAGEETKPWADCSWGAVDFDPATGYVSGVIEITHHDGTTVSGVAAYPAWLTPTSDIESIPLVVFAHGYGHTVFKSWWSNVNETAARGALAIAMDYRDNFGFPIVPGAQDTVVGAQCWEHTWAYDHAIGPRTIMGVSLGGAVAGTAIAENPDYFDHWLAIEPVTALYETWAAASLLAPGIPFAAQAAADIERDAGRDQGVAACGFQECPDAYLRRSPAHRTHEMTHLATTTVVHAVNDGLVPYDQGVQLVAGLEANGIPTRFVTVLRGDEGSNTGTTPSSHGLGQNNELDQTADLAGHGSEADRGHPVMQEAFAALWAILDGEPFQPGAGLADRDL